MIILYNTGNDVGSNKIHNNIGQLNRVLDIRHTCSLYNKVVKFVFKERFVASLWETW